ncbi:MAG: hypothetical protein EXQ69_03365 [Acidimicrobiia bacterium]|nr:hypothetical protein [Acidimicrobiia bacterium]
MTPSSSRRDAPDADTEVRAWIEARSAPATEATVSLSPVELSVLASELSLPLVPMLHFDPIAIQEPERATELDATTRAELTARGILSQPVDGEVAESIRALLELLAAPLLLLRVEASYFGAEAEWQFACTRDGAIEISEMSDRSYRFSAMALGALQPRVLELTGLEDRNEIAVEPLLVTARTLLVLPKLIEDEDEALAQLVAEGAATESARALIAALLASRCAVAVTVLYRPDENRLVGGELTWIDGFDAGLWITPTPDTTDWDMTGPEPGPEVELRPVTAEWIRAELASYLP